MRIFIPAIFTTLLTAQPLMAQNCPTLCDLNFWNSATVETVQTALDAGEDINSVNAYGYPVFWSIMTQSTSAFLLYHPQGDVEAEQQRIDSVIMLMLDSGVDTATDEAVGTPYLHLAARNSSLAVVKRMLEGGAALGEVGHDQDTVLHYAAKGGNIETIEFLINAGIDIDVKNEDSETPLHATTGSTLPHPTETTLWLIEHGADINAQSTPFYKTPIMSFFFWGGDKRVESSYTVLQAAMAAGYDITLSNNNGDNMLHYATWVGRNPEIIAYLLEQGADITVKNNDGKTAYDLALENIFVADAEIVQALR